MLAVAALGVAGCVQLQAAPFVRAATTGLPLLLGIVYTASGHTRL